MTGTKSQGNETCVTGGRKLYSTRANTGRKTDCSKSNMSRYFVTVFFFSTVIKFSSYNVYNYHIIVIMKIDSMQITSVRKEGLTIYESL